MPVRTKVPAVVLFRGAPPLISFTFFNVPDWKVNEPVPEPIGNAELPMLWVPISSTEPIRFSEVF